MRTIEDVYFVCLLMYNKREQTLTCERRTYSKDCLTSQEKESRLFFSSSFAFHWNVVFPRAKKTRTVKNSWEWVSCFERREKQSRICICSCFSSRGKLLFSLCINLFSMCQPLDFFKTWKEGYTPRKYFASCASISFFALSTVNNKFSNSQGDNSSCKVCWWWWCLSMFSAVIERNIRELFSFFHSLRSLMVTLKNV